LPKVLQIYLDALHQLETSPQARDIRIFASKHTSTNISVAMGCQKSLIVDTALKVLRDASSDWARRSGRTKHVPDVLIRPGKAALHFHRFS
jgi:hypothetical protein